MIPCHRVRRSDGRIDDYRWGEVRKIALCRHESRIARKRSTLTVRNQSLQALARNSIDLIHASLRGDLEAVQRLLTAGADANSKDENGIGTLLSYTPKVTKHLHKSGANPNIQTNEDGAPVLPGVAYMNQVDCARLLLEAGADPNTSHQ